MEIALAPPEGTIVPVRVARGLAPGALVRAAPSPPPGRGLRPVVVPPRARLLPRGTGFGARLLAGPPVLARVRAAALTGPCGIGGGGGSRPLALGRGRVRPPVEVHRPG